MLTNPTREGAPSIGPVPKFGLQKCKVAVSIRIPKGWTQTGALFFSN